MQPPYYFDLRYCTMIRVLGARLMRMHEASLRRTLIRPAIYSSMRGINAYKYMISSFSEHNAQY